MAFVKAGSTSRFTPKKEPDVPELEQANAKNKGVLTIDLSGINKTAGTHSLDVIAATGQRRMLATTRSANSGYSDAA